MDAMVNERRGVLFENLAADLKKPANCFTIDGVVTEGFRLVNDHPLSFGNSILVIGENAYVARDREHGCLHHRGEVRRAFVGSIRTENRQFPVLRQLDSEVPSRIIALVHFGLARGAKLKPELEELWSGVSGGKVVKFDTDEALVELPKGEELCIFYPDGRVCTISFESLMKGESKLRNLALDEVIDQRLDLVEERLERAFHVPDKDLRARSTDSALHQLASMLRATKDHAALRPRIFNAIEKHASGGLRKGVQDHLRLSLGFIGDTDIHPWLDVIEERDQMKALARMFPGRNEYGGGRIRSQKQNERSERDRQFRNATRGKGGSKDPQGQKGKKKK